MYLERVRTPTDLRDLSYAELTDLAGEIRDFIVGAVSETGGHLGSNLGVVELTLALHRVFESPQDAILWDTGHQAYVHKIVTGRQAQFEQLRQVGGLSGYPSREESEHDYVENSHASTILSYAYGLSVARDAGVDPHRHIVAVIGDGSMTGGMAYEALNNIGHAKKRVIMVLNDNGRSYAPTVSNLSASIQGVDERANHPSFTDRVTDKLAEALTDIRLNPVYVRRQRRLEHYLQSLPLVGHQAGSAMDAFKAGVREFLQPPSFFEALGVRYVGPFDGHNIEEMEHALHNAIELSDEGPILVHMLTQKGRGYSPAEDDDEKHLHDAPIFDPAVGPPKAVSTGYTQAFAEAIVKEAEADDRIVAITAAMPGPTGLLPFQERFPDRFFDVGIAEQHAVTGRGRHGDGRSPADRRDLLHVPQPSMGPGRVRRGAAPAAGGLLPRPGRCHRTRRRQPSRRVRHGAAVEGAGHARAGAIERARGRPDAARRDRAGRLRSGRGALRPRRGSPGRRTRSRPSAPAAAQGRRPARTPPRASSRSARCSRSAEKAAAVLAESGHPITVWDARCCSPLDPEMIADAARHDHVITIEDGIREGGIGMTIADQVSAIDPSTPVDVLGLPTKFMPHDPKSATHPRSVRSRRRRPRRPRPQSLSGRARRDLPRIRRSDLDRSRRGPCAFCPRSRHRGPGVRRMPQRSPGMDGARSGHRPAARAGP